MSWHHNNIELIAAGPDWEPSQYADRFGPNIANGRVGRQQPTDTLR